MFIHKNLLNARDFHQKMLFFVKTRVALSKILDFHRPCIISFWQKVFAIEHLRFSSRFCDARRKVDVLVEHAWISLKSNDLFHKSTMFVEHWNVHKNIEHREVHPKATKQRKATTTTPRFICFRFLLKKSIMLEPPSRRFPTPTFNRSMEDGALDLDLPTPPKPNASPEVIPPLSESLLPTPHIWRGLAPPPKLIVLI